jgi:acetolactate synthase-1/2/3 large subunit
MGYGVPGSIGAKLARPERPVVAFVGDGGFLMTGQELVTAVQEGLPVKVVLGDNGAYGTIAMHQHKRIDPDGLFAVDLKSPDFAAVARAYGAAAFVVESARLSWALYSGSGKIAPSADRWVQPGRIPRTRSASAAAIAPP